MKLPPQHPCFVELPNDWNAVQVEAVVEMLNLLLDAVCARYTDELQALMRQDQIQGDGAGDREEPF